MDANKFKEYLDGLVNDTLKELFLNNETFTPEQLTEFCSVLASNTSLEKLEIKSCHLGSNAGAIQIAKALVVNKSLKVFALTEKLGEAAVVEFAKVIVANTTLQVLKISLDKIQPDFKHLINAAHVNTSLKLLSMNSVSVEMAYNRRAADILNQHDLSTVSIINKLTFGLIKEKFSNLANSTDEREQAMVKMPKLAECPSLFDITYTAVRQMMVKNQKTIKEARTTLTTDLFAPLIKDFYAIKQKKFHPGLKLFNSLSDRIAQERDDLPPEQKIVYRVSSKK